MRKGKKFLAFVAAMAMVMAPTTTWAAQSPAESTGEAGNAGAVEGVVDKNYVSYVAPTVANNALDFVLDPQLLIQKTNGETVSGDAVVATEDGTSVYFKNATDDYDYAASSSALTVTNKGSGNISVSVKATLELDATGAAINVVTGAVASSATDTALNLNIHLDQVTGGSATASLEKETATKSALSLDVTATGAATSDFEVTKTAGKYEYVPKNANVSGDSVGFVFRGECNTNEAADWSKVKDMKASFDVVWDVKAASGNATEAYNILYQGAFYCCSGTENTDTFPAGTTFSNVKVNGVPVESSSTDAAQFGQTGVYLYITWAQCQAAGGDALGVTKDGKLTYDVTFTAGGNNYSAVYVAE